VVVAQCQGGFDIHCPATYITLAVMYSNFADFGLLLAPSNGDIIPFCFSVSVIVLVGIAVPIAIILVRRQHLAAAQAAGTPIASSVLLYIKSLYSRFSPPPPEASQKALERCPCHFGELGERWEALQEAP